MFADKFQLCQINLIWQDVTFPFNLVASKILVSFPTKLNCYRILINFHSIKTFFSWYFFPTPPHMCLLVNRPPAPLPGKHMEQKINSSTQPRTQLRPTAPSAHASYKGYGCNNAKPQRPPHRNTMIDVVVLGCGPIRTGEGAAAPFLGVHILGKIRPAGGFDTLAKSRWEDRIGPSIVVQ